MEITRTDIVDIFRPESIAKERVEALGSLEGLSEDEKAFHLDTDITKFMTSFFTSKEKFKEYCDLYAKLKNKKPYAILDAHGEVKDCWRYYVGNKGIPVQRWVNAFDGKYGTLLLACCNSPRTELDLPLKDQY